MSEKIESPDSGWTVDTLRVFIQRQLDDLRRALDARYDAQIKAVDAAFASQQTAMQTAFTAADKALDQRANTLDKEYHEHLEQVRHENTLAFINSDKAIAAALLSAKEAVNAALVSSKEAVTKAELAAEKRFESVNEFRAQLADQAATFVSRLEADAYRQGTEQKLEALKDQVDRAEKRLDLNQGRNAGSASTIGYAVTAIGVLILVINFAFFLVTK